MFNCSFTSRLQQEQQFYSTLPWKNATYLMSEGFHEWFKMLKLEEISWPAKSCNSFIFILLKTQDYPYGQSKAYAFLNQKVTWITSGLFTFRLKPSVFLRVLLRQQIVSMKNVVSRNHSLFLSLLLYTALKTTFHWNISQFFFLQVRSKKVIVLGKENYYFCQL